jgi:uncharacterized repeat protein (TIGR03847 family)
MTLSWDEDREQVSIEAREITDADLESDEDEDLQEEAVAATDDPDGPDLVRVTLQPADAQAFVTRAVAVMRAGRLACPNCGEPLDPHGHFCVRRNGYAH